MFHSFLTLFHKFSFLTRFTSFTFGDEGSHVMSVDSFTGDCALSGLFVGVMLTVSSGTVRGCDG